MEMTEGEVLNGKIDVANECMGSIFVYVFFLLISRREDVCDTRTHLC